MEETKGRDSKESDICQNPDGSFTYCMVIPCGRRESFSESQSEQAEPPGVLLPVFGSDDEAFFIVTGDIPEFVGSMLRIYNQHYMIFIMITTVSLIYELFIDFTIYRDRVNLIQTIQLTYKDHSVLYFWIAFLTDVGFSCIIYFTGIFAVGLRSYSLVNLYGKFAIVGWIQVTLFTLKELHFSLPVGLFRIAVYLYSKFLGHILLNLLLLPH